MARRGDDGCQADPKGDRVRIGMTDKFLPFRYYGAGKERVGMEERGGDSERGG